MERVELFWTQIGMDVGDPVFEFHGWAVIHSGFDLDDSRYDEDWARLGPELEEELRLFERPDHFFLHKTINGMISVTCSGLRNHRQDWAIEFFRWLAKRAPGSYGLLYVHDDEDPRGIEFENSFRVFRLAKGEFNEVDDPFLSPYIPTVEDTYGSPSWIQEKAERAYRMCRDCNGSGRCIACLGDGQTVTGECPTCSGTGMCKTCAGRGLIEPSDNKP